MPAIQSARRLFVIATAFTFSACATKGDLRDLSADMQDMVRGQESVRGEVAESGRTTLDSLQTQSAQLFVLQGTMSQRLQEILEQMELLTQLTGQNQRAIDALLAIHAAGVSNQGTGLVPGAQSGPGDMFDAAMQRYRDDDVVPARVGFQSFIQANPNDERVPEAKYRLADLLAKQERPEDAIAAFSEIPEMYLGHPRVPDALYRIGALYAELGNRAEAKRYLERVESSYSDTTAARQARRLIAELGG